MSGRRHSTGFGYIGFGNNQGVFNQSSKKPFSKYKERLDLEAHLHYKIEFLHKDLSKEDKLKIKERKAIIVVKTVYKIGQNILRVVKVNNSKIFFSGFFSLSCKNLVLI